MDKKLQIKLASDLFIEQWYLKYDCSPEETVEIEENAFILFSLQSNERVNLLKSN